MLLRSQKVMDACADFFGVLTGYRPACEERRPVVLRKSSVVLGLLAGGALSPWYKSRFLNE